MPLFERYKFQYHIDQTACIPSRDHTFSAALYEQDGQIARITLNRPEKRNAFNDAMFADLMAGLDRARHAPEVKVVIIRAAGTAFSAGHDLSSPPGEETPPIPPQLKPTVRDYYHVERRRCGKHEDIWHYPKITIAQIQGPCIGAGEFVMAACDFAIAAEDAVFGASGFGRRTVGPAEFPFWPVGSERFRAGRILPEISGREAAELGLITRAVPREQLEATVDDLAARLCRLPYQMLLLTKEWINGVLDVGGLGLGWRAHYEGHIAIQWIRFREDEVNFYKARRDHGLHGYISQRARHVRTVGSS
jgi:enoyl-CoA hydratase